MAKIGSRETCSEEGQFGGVHHTSSKICAFSAETAENLDPQLSEENGETAKDHQTQSSLAKGLNYTSEESNEIADFLLRKSLFYPCCAAPLRALRGTFCSIVFVAVLAAAVSFSPATMVNAIAGISPGYSSTVGVAGGFAEKGSIPEVQTASPTLSNSDYSPPAGIKPKLATTLLDTSTFVATPTTDLAAPPNLIRVSNTTPRQLRDDRIRSLGWEAFFYYRSVAVVIGVLLNLIGFFCLFFGMQSKREEIALPLIALMPLLLLISITYYGIACMVDL